MHEKRLNREKNTTPLCTRKTKTRFSAASRQILQRSYCRRASQTVITGNSINDAGNVIYRITDKRKCVRKSRLNYKRSIVFAGLRIVLKFRANAAG